MKKFLVAAAMLLSSAVAAHSMTKLEDSYIKDYVLAKAVVMQNTFCHFKSDQNMSNVAQPVIEIGAQILSKYPAIQNDINNAAKTSAVDFYKMQQNNTLNAYCKQQKASFNKHFKYLYSTQDESNESAD